MAGIALELVRTDSCSRILLVIETWIHELTAVRSLLSALNSTVEKATQPLSSQCFTAGTVMHVIRGAFGGPGPALGGVKDLDSEMPEERMRFRDPRIKELGRGKGDLGATGIEFREQK